VGDVDKVWREEFAAVDGVLLGLKDALEAIGTLHVSFTSE
jgi:hypothetical protein